MGFQTLPVIETIHGPAMNVTTLPLLPFRTILLFLFLYPVLSFPFQASKILL